MAWATYSVDPSLPSNICLIHSVCSFLSSSNRFLCDELARRIVVGSIGILCLDPWLRLPLAVLPCNWDNGAKVVEKVSSAAVALLRLLLDAGELDQEDLVEPLECYESPSTCLAVAASPPARDLHEVSAMPCWSCSSWSPSRSAV